MKKLIICMFVTLCLLSSKVGAEELTWGSCTTYAPMPVLFIHGINANCKTWDIAIPELKKYFGYRKVTSENVEIAPKKPDMPEDGGVTWFQSSDGKYESPARLYLEAFDYGGEDKKGSFYHIGSNYGTLTKKVEEEILPAYYGDNWKDDPNAKINIIAHSQGGLVARYYIQHGGADNVKRLITIGTPHLGSNLAVPPRIIGLPANLPILGKLYEALLLKPAGKILEVVGIGNFISNANMPALVDLCPNSQFLKELNANVDKEKGVEHVAIVCLAIPYLSDYVVSGWSQAGKGVLDDLLIKTDILWDVNHLQEGKQWKAFLKGADGIPDKGTKTYDTPKVILATSTLFYKGSADNFYIAGKIYDYLPGSCTVTIELDKKPGNYGYDKDGDIKNRAVLPINMITDTQEEPKTKNLLNAAFNFYPLNPLSIGKHTFRLTVKNPETLTGTATTWAEEDWIPFEIVENLVEIPVQMMVASTATSVPGGIQAASSLYFWDNQNNYWERWINSNLRVDSDNIIRYNCGTSNLDNPNLRHRVYLESRIYPPASMYPKASCVNKKEMQAITYTYASQPFALLPFTKEDGSVVYRPDVDKNGTITYPEDMVTFTNNEVIFTPKKDALPNLNFRPIIPGNPMYTYPLHIIIPPEYQGVSSHELDIYINQVGGLYGLESVQKAYDYSQALSNQQGFNPTINLAWAQNADLTNDGITCFGSNTAGIYRLLVNGNREDEFNEDKIIQAYGNALLTHYTNRQYGEGYYNYKLPIASITYTMSPEQAFVDGFCMRFSAAVRGTPIVELPVIAKGLNFDVSASTHRGTTSALGIAQALYRIPMKNIWQALETPARIIQHSGYTILDLLDELDSQGYDTSSIRAEFFASTQLPPEIT
ncbi:MAG: hypothetical protein AB1414_13430, partial [bacterium]